MAISEIKQKLAEAELAYHKLMLGEKEVSVSVGSFGSATYNQTSAKQLSAYISSLKNQIATLEGKPTRKIMRIEF